MTSPLDSSSTPRSSPDSVASATQLAATSFLDHGHPAIATLCDSACEAGLEPVATAVALYLAVRDGLRYSPWNVATTPEAFRAGAIAERTFEQGGHCVDKALLLAACARHRGIPSRLHFANVRNHIGTAELERQLGTDLLVFHGYTELWLNERWVAATPAFNRALCDKLGVAPLEFDGEHDSIFQAYDRKAGRFMEYVDDYGAFDDLPFELMLGEWRRYYPRFRELGKWPKPGTAVP